jgi:DNA polymerase III subunit epsilon
MYLFFDTETSGIPRNYKAPASDLSNWPRLVQLGWLLTDARAKEVESGELVIKPEGFTIPKDAVKIHGITTQMAKRDGVDLKLVLDQIEALIKQAKVLVAHNMQFDERVLGAEFLRAGYENPLESKQRICTMLSSKNYCGLPGPYGYKWPSLQELHMKLHNKAFEGAHSALVDVRACAACYFELKRLKVVA